MGVLKKPQFFRSLALLALAQQGEEPLLSTLEQYPELPVPELGGMKTVASVTKLAGNVTMDYTYSELQVRCRLMNSVFLRRRFTCTATNAVLPKGLTRLHMCATIPHRTPSLSRLPSARNQVQSRNTPTSLYTHRYLLWEMGRSLP